MNNTDLLTRIEYPNPEYRVQVEFMEINSDYKNSEAEVYTLKEMIVLIVNNGTLRVATDRENKTVEAGRGIIINSGVPFKIHLLNSEPCAFYAVVFDIGYIMPEKSLYEKYVVPYTGQDVSKLILLSEDSMRGEAFLDGFNRIIAANMLKKPGYEIATKSLLCTQWISFAEIIREGRDNEAGNKYKSVDEMRVESAIKYISENYTDLILLENIASHIRLSNSECCRCFKRVLDKSPMEYLMEYRIYSAVKRLYKDPGSVQSIGDLCFMVGFNNPSYFNKVFRRYMQCTPTKFKRLLRDDIDMAETLFSTIQEEVTLT